MIKKHVTWNSVQTWVTKIVKIHNLLVRKQPSAYRANPENECYVIHHSMGAIEEWSKIVHYLMQLEGCTS